MFKIQLHPLQKERLEVDDWYRKERDKLEKLHKEKLEEIQNECTHKWEDGSSARDWSSPPFSETFCSICHKFE